MPWSKIAVMVAIAVVALGVPVLKDQWDDIVKYIDSLSRGSGGQIAGPLDLPSDVLAGGSFPLAVTFLNTGETTVYCREITVQVTSGTLGDTRQVGLAKKSFTNPRYLGSGHALREDFMVNIDPQAPAGQAAIEVDGEFFSGSKSFHERMYGSTNILRRPE